MKDDRYSYLRQMGILTTIPAIMVLAPLIGMFLGRWLEQRFHFAPWGTLGGLAFGFAAAVREIARLLKAAEKAEQDDRD